MKSKQTLTAILALSLLIPQISYAETQRQAINKLKNHLEKNLATISQKELSMISTYEKGKAKIAGIREKWITSRADITYAKNQPAFSDLKKCLNRIDNAYARMLELRYKTKKIQDKISSIKIPLDTKTKLSKHYQKSKKLMRNFNGITKEVEGLNKRISEEMPKILPLTTDLKNLGIPGDFDQNNRVNYKDFEILSKHMGKTNALRRQGDANGDGVINQTDLNLYKKNQGKQL